MPRNKKILKIVLVWERKQFKIFCTIFYWNLPPLDTKISKYTNRSKNGLNYKGCENGPQNTKDSQYNTK